MEIDALVRRSSRDPGLSAVSGLQVNDTREADHGDELQVTFIPCSSTRLKSTGNPSLGN